MTRPARLIAPLILSFAALLAACDGGGATGPGGEGWSFELVASGREVGLHSSLAIASDGGVYVAYHDPRRHKLYLARRSANGAWTSAGVDTIGWMGEYVALCIDTDDHLHLAYQDSWLFRLRYAFFDGATWSYEHLQPLEEGGETPVSLVRPDGIHLIEMSSAVRSGGANGRINYWRKTEAGWTQLSTISEMSLRPFLGWDIGPGGPALGVLTKSVRSDVAVQASFQVKRFTAASGAGPWSETNLVNIQNNATSLQYGDRVIAVGYDPGGALHLLYLAPGGELRDSADGMVESGVANAPVIIRHGPGGELYAAFQKGGGLVASRHRAGGGWERVSRFSGFDQEGRYDFLVDTTGTLHVSFYHRTGQKLWYGRGTAP